MPENETLRRVQSLKDELSDLEGFSDFSEDEWEEFAFHFRNIRDAKVVRQFIELAQKQKFPFTERSAEEVGFDSSLLDALIKGHILDFQILPALRAKAAAHTGDEADEFEEEPRKKVKVFDLDDRFVDRFGDILQKIGVMENLNPGRGNGMSLTTESLLKKAKEINTLVEAEPGMEPGESPVGTEQEKDFFRHISDDLLEPVVDNMLTALGELEAAGKIPEITDANAARDAILALVRKLYTKRSLVGRMSRKYIRYGTGRALARDIKRAKQALRDQ